MGAFVFRLEKILEIRTREEKLALEQLGQEQKKLAAIEEHIGSIEKELSALQESFSGKQKGVLSPEEFQSNLSYFQKLQKDLTTIQDQMLVVQVEVGKKRQALKEAIQNRKVLEKLKEKQETEWNNKAKKRETAQLDEIAVQRYKRER